MCGRYVLHDVDAEVARALGLEAFVSEPRYNIAPTQSVPIVVPRSEGGRSAELARWGLVPHWVRDPASFKTLLFNARSETLFEKPSFRDAARASRAVVPASGYYEWQQQAGVKQPYLIERPDRRPLFFAALYAPAGRNWPTLSFAIVTREATAALAELHDRMPVALEGEGLDAWLDPTLRDEGVLGALLRSPDDDWRAYAVGREVGNARVDHPGLRSPAT